MAEETALITLDEFDIIAILGSKDEMEKALAQIEQAVLLLPTAIDTIAERKAVASGAYKIAKQKTAIDDAGKNLVAKAKAEIKKVDDLRKMARDELDKLKDNYRRPLTEWEDIRKEADAMIEHIRKIPGRMSGFESSGELHETMQNLLKVEIDAMVPDKQIELQAAVNESLNRLRPLFDLAQIKEAEKAQADKKKAEEAEAALAQAKAPESPTGDSRPQPAQSQPRAATAPAAGQPDTLAQLCRDLYFELKGLMHSQSPKLLVFRDRMTMMRDRGLL